MQLDRRCGSGLQAVIQACLQVSSGNNDLVVAGGAEAMMRQDQRVISTSAVRCVGNTLILQGRVYSPPYVITAIGDTRAMRDALDDDPQVENLRQWSVAVGLGYDSALVGEQTFPAFVGSIVPQHAEVPAA